MSYIGIGSPIPDISSLPGQTGGEVEVTLDYPSASACGDASPFSPSEATPPGGVFAAAPSGLNINTSTGEVTPVGSTAQAYTISYTVSGVTSQFALTINAVQQSTFSYASSSFEDSGTALPTLAAGTTSGGAFVSSSPSDLTVNASTGELTLAGATVGGPYTITYTTPGPCATSSTFDVSITAAYASTSSFSFDGVNDYIEAGVNMTDSDVTLSYWVNANGTYATSNAYYSPVAFGNTSGTGNQSLGTLYKRPNLHAGMQCFDSTDTVYTTWTARSVILEGTGWHHILWTFNFTTKHTYCYIDGAVQTFTHYSNGSTTPFLINRNVGMTTPLIMGSSWAGSAPQVGRYFGGLIDEVSAWNTVLSSDAATEIYNSGVPNDLTSLSNASSSNLKAWYKM